MYTQKYFKKESESRDLGYFLEAYLDITGEALEIAESTERPDFICMRPDNRRVGVELTEITRPKGAKDGPGPIWWQLILHRQEYMDPIDALDKLNYQAAKKESKRAELDWQCPDDTILLLQLTDIPLADLEAFLQKNNLPDLFGLGFSEIWIGDYTGIERQAYDNIELFGIYPEEWFGYYPRPLQKPYG